MATPRLRLGQLLVDAKLISAQALDQVLQEQRSDGRRIGTLLVERGLINETQLTQILSHQLSVPWVSLLKIEFSRQLLNLVPREVAEQYCLLPIYVRRPRGQGDTLYIAMEDPTNEEALRACGAHAGIPVRPMIAPPSDIRSAIRAYYGIATAETEPPPPPPSEAKPAPNVTPEPRAIRPSREPAPPPPPRTRTLVSAEAHVPGEAIAVEPADPMKHERAASAGGRSPDAPRARTLRSALHEDAGPTIEITGEAHLDLPPTVRESSKPPPAPEDPTVEPVRTRPTPTEPASIPSPRGKTARMVSLTLLDGTTITLPARSKKRGPSSGATSSRDAPIAHDADPPPESESDPGSRSSEPPPEHMSSLTARDLVSALRAVAGGADASAILGDDVRWETMFAALLSLMLKKQLIADWEFVEELNRLKKR